jgi:hypothetical protein
MIKSDEFYTTLIQKILHVCIIGVALLNKFLLKKNEEILKILYNNLKKLIVKQTQDANNYQKIEKEISIINNEILNQKLSIKDLEDKKNNTEYTQLQKDYLNCLTQILKNQLSIFEINLFKIDYLQIQKYIFII